MSNSVDPDETDPYEPSHLDLCCLQKPIIITCGSERVNETLYKWHISTGSILTPYTIKGAAIPPTFSKKDDRPIAWFL